MSDDIHDLLTRRGAAWRDGLGPDPDQKSMLARHGARRRAPLVAAAACVLVLLVAGGALLVRESSHRAATNSASNSASCAAPAFGDHPNPTTPDFGKRVSIGARTPGSAVEIYGRFYLATCADTATRGSPPGSSAPMTSVVLTFVDRNGQSTRLATIRPNSAGSFRVQIRIPPAAPAGPAILRDSAGHQLDVTVTNR